MQKAATTGDPDRLATIERAKKEPENIFEDEFKLRLRTIRNIEDLETTPYPSNVDLPDLRSSFPSYRVGLDVCTERPISLVNLELIGLHPISSKPGAGRRPGGGSNGRQEAYRVGAISAGGFPSLPHNAPFGVENSLANSRSGFSSESFRSPQSQPGESQSRSAASNVASFGSPPSRRKRTRSQRGRDRGAKTRAGGSQGLTDPAADLGPVAPLGQSEPAWGQARTLLAPQRIEGHQLVNRKVKALLNKLTAGNFDSISDQIIQWANKSEQEKDGATLIQVVVLVLEQAKEDTKFTDVYARLCRKIMERISDNIQDGNIRNFKGQPITGGMLFRKYLLDRCKEEFEREVAKEIPLTGDTIKSGTNEAAEDVLSSNSESRPYSDDPYAKTKAKLRAVGLAHLIGGLFKLQMLTERIIHECIKKLLSSAVNPQEREIFSLCALLATAGQSLNKPKARNRMDVYFESMQDMARSGDINLRIRFRLLDVIELRARHWQPRHAPLPPHLNAPSSSSGWGGVGRGEPRRSQYRDVNASVAGGVGTNQPAVRTGDLSQFGKFSKPTGLQFGPSSVFSKKGSVRELGIGRANGPNVLSALSGAMGIWPTPPPDLTANYRKANIGLRPDGSPNVGSSGMKKLNLLPRTKSEEKH